MTTSVGVTHKNQCITHEILRLNAIYAALLGGESNLFDYNEYIIFALSHNYQLTMTQVPTPDRNTIFNIYI